MNGSDLDIDPEYTEFYRSTTVGSALVETLNEMVECGEISEDAASEVLCNFEATFLEVLREETSKALAPKVSIEV